MRRIFGGFCINWILIDPLHLHYISSRSGFSFEFAEIFVIEKLLADSLSRGVADFPSRCCRFSDSASRGVDDSPTHHVGESAIEFSKKTPLFGESESH
jgi:hypothetical protein